MAAESGLAAPARPRRVGVSGTPPAPTRTHLLPRRGRGILRAGPHVRGPGPSRVEIMADANPPPLRLLLVDDDEGLRQPLAQGLRRQGMQVWEAGDGPDALALAA